MESNVPTAFTALGRSQRRGLQFAGIAWFAVPTLQFVLLGARPAPAGTAREGRGDRRARRARRPAPGRPALGGRDGPARLDHHPDARERGAPGHRDVDTKSPAMGSVHWLLMRLPWLRSKGSDVGNTDDEKATLGSDGGWRNSQYGRWHRWSQHRCCGVYYICECWSIPVGYTVRFLAGSVDAQQGRSRTAFTRVIITRPLLSAPRARASGKQAPAHVRYLRARARWSRQL